LACFHSQNKIFKLETLTCSKTQLFTHFTIFHFDSKQISSNLEKKFFIEPSMKPTNQPWTAFAFFHAKIMKVITFCIETCLFMIQHEEFNLHIHVSNLIFFIKISVMHMKSIPWPIWQAYQFQHQIIPYFHKTWLSCPKHIKINILAFLLFQRLSNF
jgi:hypothetical protein